ncbi:RNA-binding S4 domain-containing protein [Kocuria massiliensis]|uniref:RNA-binding S4 domain-containing protein n=1 Tax=Kocuria massiliensis TaxID=1926282 RepID=UPI003B3B4185
MMTRGESVEEIDIRDDMIRLGQLLKLANLVGDGLEAREVIAEGLVTVNDEPETQRGKQIHPGDVVRLGDAAVRVTRSAS